MSNSRLVYSSDGGRVAHKETIKRRPTSSGPPVPQAPADGWIRLWRVKGGRGGKTVTVVTGLPADQLEDVWRELRRIAGAGGAVRDDVVEIQGDCRERLQPRLEALGFRVKIAGG